MNVGKMRHRVEWIQVSTTADSFGQITRSETSQGTYWASVRPVSGDEKPQNKGQELRADRTHTVTMRYVGVPAAGDRLKFKGRSLEIISVMNTDELNDELILSCKEAHAS